MTMTAKGEHLTLKVSVQDGKSCEKILTVEVGEDTIRREYEEFYQSVAPKAKIPGFRPGKAPRDVLVMYFKNDARESVRKHLISESYRQALHEKALEPLNYPDIRDVNFEDKKLFFRARIEVRPKIKLGRVSGLSAKKETAEVKAEEVEEAVTRLQASLAQYKAVEDRPAAMGDFVIADYVCTCEGREIEKRTDDWFELREEEFLKGFSAQLAGAKPGEEREVRIPFPDSMSDKKLAGKPAVFAVKVKEIKVRILPELNDDFAREAGEYKTLAELKEKISRDLLKEKERHVEHEYERALLDELLKHHKIDLPKGLIDRRQENLFERTKHELLSRGTPAETIEKEKEKLMPELESQARRDVHLAFLLDEIALQHEITVGEEDLKRRYEDIAQRVRQPLEEVEKYYREHEDARQSLSEQIRNEKAIELIKRNAKQK